MIRTPRLVLRTWQRGDVAPFHAIGRDRKVMRHLGPSLTRSDAWQLCGDMADIQARHGYSFWAMERRADRRMIGFCGLNPLPAPVAGQVEIGWRLASDCWGQGFAREAAEATLAWGWQHLGAKAIVAVTTPGNTRSWGLMERLGMTRCPDEDFPHPDLLPDDPLSAHILYRIARPAGA